ncbi:hypothetical protein LSH36_17g10008 [Paralvinella palmiformis]|uniref:Uncharacterized protein n=1 Tax=Paralvinella palmiformis TaxID=53620 RepID=A0AAD9NH49_9ANNE|nr:hypothetical protein LSH36_17g10008 [Paralvinella palmiformis]
MENNVRNQKHTATKETKRITVEKQVQCDINGTSEAKDKAEPFSRKGRFRRPVGRRGQGPTPKHTHYGQYLLSDDVAVGIREGIEKDKGVAEPELRGDVGEDEERASKLEQKAHIINFPQHFESAEQEMAGLCCVAEPTVRRANSFVGCQLRYRTGDDRSGTGTSQHRWHNGALGSSAATNGGGTDRRQPPNVGPSPGAGLESLRRAVNERRSYHVSRSATVAPTGGGGGQKTFPGLSIASANRATGEASQSNSPSIGGQPSGAGYSGARPEAALLTSQLGADPVERGQREHDRRDLGSQIAPTHRRASVARTAATASAPAIGTDRMPATPSGYPDAYLGGDDYQPTDRTTPERKPGSFTLLVGPTRAGVGPTRATNSYRASTNGASTLLREVEQLIREIPATASSVDDRDRGQTPKEDPEKEMDPYTNGESTSRQNFASRRKKVDTADPGVSNTTQLLIQQHLRKSTFQFPEVSMSEKRRALGTPRDDAGVSLTHRFVRSNLEFQQRSQRTSRTSRQSRRDLSRLSSIESGFDLDLSSSRDSDQFKSRHLDQSASRISDVVSNPASNQPSQGAKSSNATPVGPNRGRYSKLVSLGLPNVKLDLDHNHFSRGSIRRRSQRLRQNLDSAPESTTGESSRADSVKSSATVAVAAPKDLIVVNTGLESVEHGKSDPDDPDQTWPGLKLDLNYTSVAETAGQMLSQSMDMLRDPVAERNSLSVVPPSPRRSRSSGGGGATPRAEATISYSFYQLQPPPGPAPATGQGIEVVKGTNSLTPKYSRRRQYTVNAEGVGSDVPQSLKKNRIDNAAWKRKIEQSAARKFIAAGFR